MSFFQLGAEHRLQGNQLLALHDLLDWTQIERLLQRIHKRDWTQGGGPNPYPPIQMFKAMLLGHWHSLSDQGLVDSLRVRLDFMVFSGFGLDSELPDESTFCRFRKRLRQLHLDEKLFHEINRQLGEKGLHIKEATTAVVDATVIESASRPRRCIEVSEDREEESQESTTAARIIESADPDARWLKKGKRSYFGYKGFVSVEAEHGFIQDLKVTPANVAEVNQLQGLVESLPLVDLVMADKAYASQANRDYLREQEIHDAIMHKNSRGKGLTETAKDLNRQISKVRYIVEQCFGTLKQRFSFQRSRYRTTAGVQTEFYWKAMCFNLLKAQRILQA